MLKWEEFFTEEEVQAYKKVKLGLMHLANVKRSVVADMVGGTIKDHGKEFLYTSNGIYRLAPSKNSDNSTEKLAHEKMGVKSIDMSDWSQMKFFFMEHGLDQVQAYLDFRKRVQEKLSLTH